MPDGLSARARDFVSSHGVRVECVEVEPCRERWLSLGVPAEEFDRAAAFQARWGGLALPPSSEYDGGPESFDTDLPECSAYEGWWIPAGETRTALPYSFMINTAGEFGLCHWDTWVPLHATVEGWVESLALAHYAAERARKVTKHTGRRAAKLSLAAYDPVPEVMGLADTWWRGEDSLVAVYTGEARLFSTPSYATSFVYSGLSV